MVEIDFSKPDTTIVQKTEKAKELTFAISAMYTPKETFIHYKELVSYISDKIKMPIIFKQRKTYAEINELLVSDELDFAFICTGAYQKIKTNPHIEMLCIPIINNQPYYFAFVIVNNKSNLLSIDDLKDNSFAFTDPLSNTGHDYIINLLKSKGQNPMMYFNKTIFTYGHNNSILAVSKNAVDGASINSLIYEYYLRFEKEKIANIRIINKSEKFGMPPFVVSSVLDEKIKTKLRNILLNMDKDKDGVKILNKLMINRFEIPDNKIYEEKKEDI